RRRRGLLRRLDDHVHAAAGVLVAAFHHAGIGVVGHVRAAELAAALLHDLHVAGEFGDAAGVVEFDAVGLRDHQAAAVLLLFQPSLAAGQHHGADRAVGVLADRRFGGVRLQRALHHAHVPAQVGGAGLAVA